ncbi:hypothetical protein LCGC14_3166860, partial [marine sediment metagenome]
MRRVLLAGLCVAGLFMGELLAQLPLHKSDVLPDQDVVTVGNIRFFDLDYPGSTDTATLQAPDDITTGYTLKLFTSLAAGVRCLEVNTASNVGQLQLASGACGTGGGSSEWTGGAGFMFVTDGTAKAVSIGLATEDGKLSVYGDDAAQEGLVVRGVGSQTADIVTVENSVGTPLFVVKANGRTGFGTANPTAQVEVSGATAYIQITGTSGVDSGICGNSGTGAPWCIYENFNNSDMILWANGADRMILEGGGAINLLGNLAFNA